GGGQRSDPLSRIARGGTGDLEGRADTTLRAIARAGTHVWRGPFCAVHQDVRAHCERSVIQVNIADRRKSYAASITARRGITEPRVQRAFETVPREHFVGPGPWEILTPTGYVSTSSSASSLLYEDVVVALSPEKRINN